MTSCARPLDALLEADLAVLRGVGDSELAAHIRSCERCRSAARSILNGTAVLDAALVAPATAPDVDAILARARTETTRTSADRRRLRAKRWVTLAAAAVAALMVIGRRMPPPVTSTLPEPVAPPLVEASDAADVAVISTANPDITILWLFQGGRGR